MAILLLCQIYSLLNSENNFVRSSLSRNKFVAVEYFSTVAIKKSKAKRRNCEKFLAK
jgi:hypothetical protein